ncbi:methylated-DNA--[protein]-cysteine S-methyltransferase [Saccharibacillus alkalitolerans]|uniref:Methylated-DNA--protein-cysteine methyltransferase n=1 Tax=Saccharibacillus alkalitolerans TaxID=2705290 RepID=A0ABX0F7Z8_9BACL|nr:methylated-DNA--[protein]-cysteine S-methyltransferase [Saccharibacillus alkalitolerans]NGZ77092.1 methylated-DNA--[protein]-cysteine S-methyltransferase [Saccharibacillus alkalitolerans]
MTIESAVLPPAPPAVSEPAAGLHRLLYFSPLGELIIEGTDEAVHSILFADTAMPDGWPEVNPFPDAAAPEAHESDPPADRMPKALGLCRRQLAEYFRGQRRTFDFPYAFVGTPFQRSVWTELAAVPYAASRSYKDLAAAIGSERAVRAVGSANGRNKLSIVLPCHRIIGSGGKLTGYAGGLWRKEWLLRHEARFGL